MEGADICKASSRTQNGKRSPRLPLKEEKTGALPGGVLLLLPFGVKIVEDGFALDFINHVIDCTYDDVRVYMVVIRQERSHIIQMP